jgi:cytochrome P450/nitrite reductase/ring-hydroxylating ferredoxin subunit
MVRATDTTWARAGRVADLAGDGPFAISAEGSDLVALRTGGKLKVFEGRCPHQGALLGEGELQGGALVCRNHGWRFDASTGRRDGGPQCLRACPSEVRGDELWVDVAALRADAAQSRPRRQIADLPGPRGLPIVGNGLQLDIRQLHIGLEDWARKYGPVFTFRPGPRAYLGVSDAELIEQVLRQRPETYRRDSRVEPVFAELGVAGVFSAEGTAWRPQRRLAMEALSQRNLRTFFPTMVKIAERLRKRWTATAGTVIDLQDDLMRFAVDVTTSLVFGKDLNTIEGGEDVIQRELALVFPTFARRLNALIPYWRVLRLPRDRKVDRAIATLRVWLAELIGETRARVAAEPGRPAGNFLEAMIAARDDDGQPFSDEVLFGNAMTMLLAGEDTTANSVAWAVHLLCDHPAEVGALRTELDAVLGDAAVPPDLERTNKLDRATAVSQESMRLLPVAPLNFVEAIHDTVLGDVDVPKGTGVVVLGRIPATDAKNFVDPATFQPARWMEGIAGAHEASALLPFGSGPRICPGRTLALVEMRVMLATLYKSFDVERVGEASAVTEHYNFTVMPSDLKVRLRPR